MSALFVAATSITACDFPKPPDVPGPDDDDTVPPTVVATNPQSHAAGVDPVAVPTISVTFSEAIDVQGGSQFSVTSAGGDVQGTVVADGATLTFRPSTPLVTGAPFTVSVDGVADGAGNKLAAPYTFDFTTRTTLCVKEGGGNGCLALPSEAIAAAAAGSSIAIAAGNYLDNFVIDKTINLLGGFDSSFATRDSSRNITTIRPKAPASMSISIVDISTGSSLLDGITLTAGDSGGEHGGALRVSGGAPRIQNSVISGNTASFLAGGVYIFNATNVQLVGNRIENNTLNGQNSSGGGVAVENSTVVFRDNLITGNRVSGASTQGGGVVLYGSTATFVNNRIEGNHVGGSGQVGNGGGVASSGSHVTMTGGTVSRNDTGDTTGAGGGLYVSMGDARFDDVRIEGNAGGPLAGAGASGIHSTGATLIVTGSIIAGNLGGTAGVSVGPQGTAAIINCTIADNPMQGINTTGYLTVVNSVILREPVGITVSGTPAPPLLVRTNALFSNAANVVGMTLDASNLLFDPKVDSTFHLMAGSPLIDAAMPGPIQTADTFSPPIELPGKDIDGDPRVLGAKPDIGADEFRSSP